MSEKCADSDDIAPETTKFNQHIRAFVFNNVAELVRNTLPHKWKNLPINDFMKFIEATYKRQINLTSSKEICFQKTTSVLEQSQYYDRVNRYLNATNAPEASKDRELCIDTFHKILQEPFLTEKELLLLIRVWEEKHALAKILKPEIPCDLETKIIEKIDTLYQLKAMQEIEFETSCKKTSDSESAEITANIFSCIHQSTTLFEPYCHYLLNKTQDNKGIDSIQLNFLAKNFKDIKNILQKPDDVKRLKLLCQTIWNAKIAELQKKVGLSAGFFKTRRSTEESEGIELEVIDANPNLNDIKKPCL